MRVTALGALVALLIVLVSSPERAHADESRLGYDISWPQCGQPYPSGPFQFAVIGVDYGKAFTKNPCFASQYKWAAGSGTLPGLYMTLRQPAGPTASKGMSGPAGACAASNMRCISFNYGYNAAVEAAAYAQAEVKPPKNTMWWLDIETVSSWSTDKAVNAWVIAGAIEYFTRQGSPLGIYSTAAQWATIAGDFQPGLPTWVAGAPNAVQAERYCANPRRSFGGGEMVMVQYVLGKFDHNFLCREQPQLAALVRRPLPAAPTALAPAAVAGVAAAVSAALPQQPPASAAAATAQPVPAVRADQPSPPPATSAQPTTKSEPVAAVEAPVHAAAGALPEPVPPSASTAATCAEPQGGGSLTGDLSAATLPVLTASGLVPFEPVLAAPTLKVARWVKSWATVGAIARRC